MQSYEILDADSSETLALKVREAIGRGMVPCGSVTVQPETFWEHQWFFQAVCDPKLLQSKQEAN